MPLRHSRRPPSSRFRACLASPSAGPCGRLATGLASPWSRLRGQFAIALAALLSAAACGPQRLSVVGPLGDPAATAQSLRSDTELEEPVRIDFRWRLNEAGSRVTGVGVARIEPPNRARLDLFLDNDESVTAAALVDDELRLPPGAPDDILPPVQLMWGTLGVFRPTDDARLVGGDRLQGSAERLRYAYGNGTELHYQIEGGEVRRLDLIRDGSVVEWMTVEHDAAERWPASVVYRNLTDFRELEITRTSVTPTESFDPAIWDPRE